jgi:lipid-binding SYLF domain-containing protein
VKNFRVFLAVLFGISGLFAVCAVREARAVPAQAATAQDLIRESDQSMQKLISTNKAAATLSPQAKAVLIFPKIIKAGLIFGGAYGEGILKIGPRVDGYYNSVQASWGLQAGAEAYGYVVFLMTDNALNYIRETRGWEIGTGPTLVVVNEGVAKNLTTTTLLDKEAYAFIFDQKGLMASLSIEGTKITRIRNP